MVSFDDVSEDDDAPGGPAPTAPATRRSAGRTATSSRRLPDSLPGGGVTRACQVGADYSGTADTRTCAAAGDARAERRGHVDGHRRPFRGLQRRRRARLRGRIGRRPRSGTTGRTTTRRETPPRAARRACTSAPTAPPRTGGRARRLLPQPVERGAPEQAAAGDRRATSCATRPATTRRVWRARRAVEADVVDVGGAGVQVPAGREDPAGVAGRRGRPRSRPAGRCRSAGRQGRSRFDRPGCTSARSSNQRPNGTSGQVGTGEAAALAARPGLPQWLTHSARPVGVVVADVDPPLRRLRPSGPGPSLFGLECLNWKMFTQPWVAVVVVLEDLVVVDRGQVVPGAVAAALLAGRHALVRLVAEIARPARSPGRRRPRPCRGRRRRRRRSRWRVFTEARRTWPFVPPRRAGTP